MEESWDLAAHVGDAYREAIRQVFDEDTYTRDYLLKELHVSGAFDHTNRRWVFHGTWNKVYVMTIRFNIGDDILRFLIDGITRHYSDLSEIADV